MHSNAISLHYLLEFGLFGSVIGALARSQSARLLFYEEIAVKEWPRWMLLDLGE